MATKKAARKTAKKAASKKTASKTSAKKTPAKKSTKKSSVEKTARSSGEGAACWPGFKRVPGTKAGAEGSCEPKEHQTKGEKKADSKAAAARKREKSGHD